MTAANNKSGPADPSQKVAPYPILVGIVRTDGTPPSSGHILKLTDIGFLMRVEESQFYKVGENLHQISFEIPVLGSRVRTAGKVIKTYDGLEQMTKEGMKKMKTVEVHFLSLSDENRRNIHSFLVKIGQTKP